MKIRTSIITAGLALALVASAAASAAGKSEVTVNGLNNAESAESLAFTSTVNPYMLPAQYVFIGSLGGSASGGVASRIVSIRMGGAINQLTVVWTVSVGAGSFTALTSGTWNSLTGQIVMNGQVTQGHLKGAHVEEEGHFSPYPPSFQGVLRVLPGTAS